MKKTKSYSSTSKKNLCFFFLMEGLELEGQVKMLSKKM